MPHLSPRFPRSQPAHVRYLGQPYQESEKPQVQSLGPGPYLGKMKRQWQKGNCAGQKFLLCEGKMYAGGILKVDLTSRELPQALTPRNNSHNIILSPTVTSANPRPCWDQENGQEAPCSFGILSQQHAVLSMHTQSFQQGLLLAAAMWPRTCQAPAIPSVSGLLMVVGAGSASPLWMEVERKSGELWPKSAAAPESWRHGTKSPGQRKGPPRLGQGRWKHVGRPASLAWRCHACRPARRRACPVAVAAHAAWLLARAQRYTSLRANVPSPLHTCRSQVLAGCCSIPRIWACPFLHCRFSPYKPESLGKAPAGDSGTAWCFALLRTACSASAAFMFHIHPCLPFPPPPLTCFPSQYKTLASNHLLQPNTCGKCCFEDTNLISGFDVPEGSEKVAEDEFDPIPVLISKNSQGLQGDATGYLAVNAQQGRGGPPALGCFPPDQQQQGDPDCLARDGPSSNSSFHSSEGEGTDHEGDILDCSGSRPLLLDSEEEEEACRMNLQLQERGRASHEGLAPQLPPSGPQPPPGETLDERDVFATAPFRSSRPLCDDLDIFAKAPFLSRSPGCAKQLDEGDVFLRAPFTKRKSQEELASCTALRDSPATVACLAQHACGPVFQSQAAARPGPWLPQAQHSVAPLGQPPGVPPGSERAHEGPGAALPKDALGELGGIAVDPLQGHARGPKAGKPFRLQALARYSRHYSPEAALRDSAQPIAAYKVVSQTNKQAIAGSVSIASLSSRTKELPGSDPFASAPFPSKLGRQKP
ncbi:hypothetical protein EYD10_16566 [Varanus komodoensis]|nr:hypothetical protein EYD10_16566 [Varanus komodoensis]